MDRDLNIEEYRTRLESGESEDLLDSLRKLTETDTAEFLAGWDKAAWSWGGWD